MTTILKTLVGSRAHGLDTATSDYDWRGIFVQPTREILSLGYNARTVQWLEGKEDFTNYEIGHFLMLATKANPSVLELLVSPRTEMLEIHGRCWGAEMVALFPYLYDPRDAYNAFTGYSHNQRKKLLEDKDGRKWKYSVAYIRTLYNLIDLLTTGTFSLVVNKDRLPHLMMIRDGQVTAGDVINTANDLIDVAKDALPHASNRQDLTRVNAFLLDVRKAFWSYK